MAAPKGHPPYQDGGRPPKYTIEFIENEAEELMKWLKKGKFTWFERFAIDRGIPLRLFSSWAKENAKFSEAYECAKDIQKALLMEKGLDKTFQFNMVKLILSHSYGINEANQNPVSAETVQLFETLMQQFNKNQQKE